MKKTTKQNRATKQETPSKSVTIPLHDFQQRAIKRMAIWNGCTPEEILPRVISSWLWHNGDQEYRTAAAESADKRLQAEGLPPTEDHPHKFTTYPINSLPKLAA